MAEYYEAPCQCSHCGSEGAIRLYDGYGIYVGRYCDEDCAIAAGYRADIFGGHYECDEVIEEEDLVCY